MDLLPPLWSSLPGNGAAKRAHLLVAEDNVVNQQVAVLMLTRLGCGVDAVANGHEVLRALEQIPYDLVFMDCQMPEMDGYEAALEIRRRAGDCSHVPIIALTAHASAEDRNRCLAAGMNDYLSKPLKAEAKKSAINPGRKQGKKPRR